MHDSVESSLVESNVLYKVNYVIVRIPCIKASIAVLYKKPTVSNNKFLAALSHILSKTNNIILIGDTNINIQKHSAKTTEYLSLFRSLGYQLLNSPNIQFATRLNNHINARHTLTSTIDHVISNCFNFKFCLCVNETHLSDHRELFLSFRDTTNKTVNFRKTDNIFIHKRLNLDHFRRLLSRELSRYTPVNFSSLLHLIQNIKTRCIQSRTFHKQTNPNKQWVNNELTDLIRERNRYHKLLKRFPSNDFLKSKHFEYCNLMSYAQFNTTQ